MNEISYNFNELKNSITPLKDVRNCYSELLNSLQSLNLFSELTSISLLDNAISSVDSFLSSEVEKLVIRLLDVISVAEKIEYDFPNFFDDFITKLEDKYLPKVNCSIFYNQDYISSLMNSIELKCKAIGNKNYFVEPVMLYENGLGDHTLPNSLRVKLGGGECCFVNIKGEVNRNSPIYVINQGGYEQNLNQNYINNYNLGPDGVYVRMFGSFGGEMALDDVYVVTEAIAESLNVKVTNTIPVGFSGGGTNVMQLMADMCRNNKVINPSFVLCDAYTIPIPFSTENLQTLGDNNAVMYSVYHKGAGSLCRRLFADWEEQYGVNIVYVEVPEAGHEPTFARFLNDGMIHYMTDNTAFPTSSIISSEVYNRDSKSWESIDLANMTTKDVEKIVLNN